MAFGIQLSIDCGYGGAIYPKAKTTQLQEHSISAYGAIPVSKEDLAYVVYFRKTCQRYQINFSKADSDERNFVIHMAEKTFLQKRA